MARVVLVVFVVALTVYALIDLSQADGRRVRLMPRWLWAVAILVPAVGALAWLFFGRPQGRNLPPGQRRPIAPDDDPDFLRGL